jgi:CheY-like chemotaxis protein
VKKVWILDDDEEMIRAVQLMLKLLDCDTRFFYDARPAARTLLAGEMPDLFILDINMPEVNGVQFLEFLRTRSALKHLPVVMLSSEASELTVDKTLAIGADAYVLKPVTIDELEQAMNKAFAAHGVQPL